MAETRLPDVVPVTKDVSSFDCGDTIGSMTGDPLMVACSQQHKSDDHQSRPPDEQHPPPLRVEIWTNSHVLSPPGSPSSHPLLMDSSSLADRRVSTGHHSDSGIDSLLPSPTVSSSGDHHRKQQQRQTFVSLDLSAQHLAVPGLIFRRSLHREECDETAEDDDRHQQHPEEEDDCRSAAEECDDEDSDPEAGRPSPKR